MLISSLLKRETQDTIVIWHAMLRHHGIKELKLHEPWLWLYSLLYVYGYAHVIKIFGNALGVKCLKPRMNYTI
jgi:hypothetical protein